MTQPDSPAAELRAAAEILHHAARRATHDQGGRWMLGHTKGTRAAVVLDHPDTPTVLIETYAERLEAVNAYLALLGPVFGESVADWLKHAARRHDALVQAAHSVWHDDTEAAAKHIADETDHRALAVARALLGSQP